MPVACPDGAYLNPLLAYLPFVQQAKEFIDFTRNQVLRPARGIRVTDAYMHWVQRCYNFARLTGYKLCILFLQTHQHLRLLRRQIGLWDLSDTSSIPTYFSLRRQAKELSDSLQLTGQLIVLLKLHSQAQCAAHQLDPAAVSTFFSSLFRARITSPSIDRHRSSLLATSTSLLAASTITTLNKALKVEDFETVIHKSRHSRSAAGANGLPHVFWASNVSAVFTAFTISSTKNPDHQCICIF